MAIPRRGDSLGIKRIRQSCTIMAISSALLLLLLATTMVSSRHHSTTSQADQDLTHYHHTHTNHLNLNILSRFTKTPPSSSSSSSSSTSSSSSEGKKKEEICSKTQYPDLCMQTINASSPNDTSTQLTSISARFALRLVNQAYDLSSQLSKQKGGNPMETAALQDCHELMDDARDQISLSISALFSLPHNSSSPNPSILDKKLQTISFYLSSSLSLQTACSDGLSTFPPGIRSKIFLSYQKMLSKITANCLGLTKSLRKSAKKADVNFHRQSRSRHLLAAASQARKKEEQYVSFSLDQQDGYPEWLPAKDRKLLQMPASSVSANATVAKDGTGQYKTFQEAVNGIPRSYSGRYIIYIKKGTYQENVTIAKKYKNLALLGDGINRTIITGKRNVALLNYTTYRSATVAVSSPGFMAKGITFQNTAGPKGHQAVALRVNGDLSVFESCSFKGYQDTLYALGSRHFYRGCDIYGTVDYIFGNAIAIFQNCNLYARLPMKGQKNTYTAQGRTIADDPSGYSFQNCRLVPSVDLTNSTYNVSTYLGRPWKAYSRTVFMRSYMGSLINVDGWLAWNTSNPYIDTLYYGEYRNTGPGSNIAQRVTWSGVHSNMSFNEAYEFSPDNFISASTWLPDMGVTYQELS